MPKLGIRSFTTKVVQRLANSFTTHQIRTPLRTRGFTKEFFFSRARLIRVGKKFDSVEVESAVANCPNNSNPFGASLGKKFNLDLSAQGEIRNGKQAHSDVTQIDAESIEVMRSGEYANGGIQQLALPTATIWLGVESEVHSLDE